MGWLPFWNPPVYQPPGAGAVRTTIQKQLADVLYINVRNFRAPGDPDDALSIRRAAAYAKSLRSVVSGTIPWQRRRAVLHFPSALQFQIATPVRIPANVSVVMESPIVVTAAAGALPSDFGDHAAWVDIGGDAAAFNQGSRWCRFVISVIRATQSNWSSLDDLGVRLQNIQSSRIDLSNVLGFARNVELFAGAFCIAFNDVTIGDLRGAKIHLTLNAGPFTPPFNDQFVNQNQFHGGEFANGGGEGDGTSDIVGIWLKGGNQEAYNSNMFMDQCYEFSTSGKRIAVWIEGIAASCRWLRQRTESVSIAMRIDDAETSACLFDDDYMPFDKARFDGTAMAFEDKSRAKTNQLLSQGQLLFDRLIPVWDSGMIAKRSNQYDGATAYAVGGFDIAASDFTMSAGATLIDISADAVRHQEGRDLVRWLDTSVNKRFVFFVATGDPAKAWLPRFRPYGADGKLLVPAETSPGSGLYRPPYVNGVRSDLFLWNPAAYGSGAYVASGAATSNYLYVSFRDEVKKAAFCLPGSGSIADGTAYCKKSVKIMALDSPCASWIEARAPFDNGEYIGTAAPAAGTWARGTRVYNLTPSAAGPEGWICVAAGTPGTWKAFGTIAS